MQRVVELEGGRNFRDLGGYLAAGGRTVRWGMLYRSGTLHKLTASDLSRLRALGIRLVCDFRAPDERAEQPTHWPEPAPEILFWDDRQEAQHRGFADPGRQTLQDGREIMLGVYNSLAEQHADKFQALFRQLIKGNLPALFHCSLGKDRTGIAAALILTALGVARHLVLEDYALTETLVDFVAVLKDDAAQNPQSMLARYMQRPDEYITSMLRSDAAYLNSALQGLEQRYGSVEAYITSVLGVDDDEIVSLRNRLLE